MNKKTLNQSDFQALSARDRILLTAHDFFYKEGIRATGVDLLIKESGVTKVTFYRHFSSKNDLIVAFLHYRHQRWINWFSSQLQKNGSQPKGVVQALSEWFTDSDYRGCAFINSVGELGQDIPEVVEITRNHKKEMVELILDMLPKSEHRQVDAEAIGVAIDGAIVRAQYETDKEKVVQSFGHLIECFLNQA